MISKTKLQHGKERRQSGAQSEGLKDRRGFEMLLVETSARMINLPADRVDEEILAALRRVCEHLDLDRSTLWLLSDREALTMQLEHFYDRGNLSAPRRLDAKRLFPWVTNKLLTGEVLAISKLSDLPPEATRDLESIRSTSTKSALLIPLLTDGSVFGAMSFALVRQEREWREELVCRLKLVAQIFASALSRKRSEQLLRESWARLSLAADSANAALWRLDMDSGQM